MSKPKKTKKELLDKIQPSNYRIYGIFDFTKEELVYVHLDQDQVELEFELSGYSSDRYDIVEFEVILI
jgi:hypothetical protein